jgi:hypothetical protein
MTLELPEAEVRALLQLLESGNPVDGPLKDARGRLVEQLAACEYKYAILPTRSQGGSRAQRRGPEDPNQPGWQFVIWKDEAADPGGWAMNRVRCSADDLPEWAKDLLLADPL